MEGESEENCRQSCRGAEEKLGWDSFEREVVQIGGNKYKGRERRAHWGGEGWRPVTRSHFSGARKAGKAG